MFFRAGVQHSGNERAVLVRSSSALTFARALVVAIIALIAASSLQLMPLPLDPPVFADDDEEKARKIIDDARKDGEYDGKEGEKKLFRDLGKNPRPKDGTFLGIFKRLAGFQYINYTPKGHPPAGFPKAPFDGNKFNCHVNAPGAGTPVYHNCDVPNIGTEFYQDLYASFIPSGIQGGQVVPSYAPFGLGIPQSLPNGNVPAKAGDRAHKYTGLELYGYSARLTSYKGEWDHIKVMTTSRALSNFGLADSIVLGGKAVMDATLASIDAVADTAASGPAGFFKAFFFWPAIAFSSGAPAALNTIFDTSDLNVFNTKSWYRVDYGSTIYNGRELSNAEIAALAQSQIIDSVLAKLPNEGKVPDELSSLKDGPPAFEGDISKCEIITDKDGKNFKETMKSSTSPGPSEEKCRNAGVQAKADLRSGVANNKTFKWSKDGNASGMSFKEWESKNKKYKDAASKYGISCEAPEDSEGVPAYQRCWEEKYPDAANKALQKSKTEEANAWQKAVLSFSGVYGELRKNGDQLFNAPENRYVCTDKNGKDLRSGEAQKLVSAYDSKGNLGKGCQPLRPPIQNGLVGNGYRTDLGQTAPQPDTRWSGSSVSSLAYAVVPIDSWATTFANGGIAVAGFATAVSNVFMSLTWSPILTSLDINKTLVSLIESMRDGVFFPLVVVMSGILGFLLVVQTARNRSARGQFVSILIIVANFAVGILMMSNPKGTLKMVDEIPSVIETAIVGTVFEATGGSSNEICTTSGSPKSGGFTDLNGKGTSFSPSQSARSLMCENWRAFYFNPYVHAQWGTNFDNLYAKGKAPSHGSSLQNKNEKLVGNAAVNMGGGRNVHNWALYQIDTMTSGTTTDLQLSTVRVSAPPNLYRVVDVQMGPNNGKLSDGKYAHAWSGKNPVERFSIGVIAPAAALVGAITVVIFSAGKIAVTLVSTLMLLVLPFVFLGVFIPGRGMMIVKSFFGTLLGLMVQRILLTILLAILFTVLVASANSSSSYLMSALIGSLFCIVFLMYYKSLTSLMRNAVTGRLGDMTKGAAYSVAGRLGRSALRQPGVSQVKAYTAGIVGGTVGAKLAGGENVSLKDAHRIGREEASVRAGQRRRRINLRGELGPVASIYDTSRRAAADAGYDEQYGKEMQGAREQITAELKEHEKLHKSPAKKSEEIGRPVPAYMERMEKKPFVLGDSHRERKWVRRVSKRNAKIAQLEKRARELVVRNIDPADRADINRAGRHLRGEYRRMHDLDDRAPVSDYQIEMMMHKKRESFKDMNSDEKKSFGEMEQHYDTFQGAYEVVGKTGEAQRANSAELEGLKAQIREEYEKLEEEITKGAGAYDRDARKWMKKNRKGEDDGEQE